MLKNLLQSTVAGRNGRQITVPVLAHVEEEFSTSRESVIVPSMARILNSLIGFSILI